MNGEQHMAIESCAKQYDLQIYEYSEALCFIINLKSFMEIVSTRIVFTGTRLFCLACL